MEWNNSYQQGTKEWHQEVKRHNIEDSRVRKVEKVELLAIHSVVGNGTNEFPTKRIVEYFDLDGNLIFKDTNPNRY